MHPSSIDGVNRLHAMKHRRNDRPGDFVDQLAEDRVFLRWATNDGKRPDRAFAMEVVSKAVIAQVIAEWTFGQQARLQNAGDAKVCLGVNWQFVTAANHPHAAAIERTGESKFRHPFR